MEKNPMKKLRRSIRLVVGEDQSTVRHFASIAMTTDGGVMVTPVNHTEAAWELDEMHEPILSGEVTPTATWSAASTPRLHYHRSGYTNIAAQKGESGLQRPSVQLPPLASVSGKQIFSLTITRPDLLPPVPLSDVANRRSGTVLLDALYDGLPPMLTVVGILYKNAIAPWWRNHLDEPSNPAFHLKGRIAESCYSLEGHGISSFLVFRVGQRSYLNLHPGLVRQFPSISLVGLCGLREWPSPSVGATTVGAPRTVLLFSRAELPKFPKVPGRIRYVEFPPGPTSSGDHS